MSFSGLKRDQEWRRRSVGDRREVMVVVGGRVMGLGLFRREV